MLRNLLYVLSLSFKAVLSRLVAVLYYVLRVRYCLSVLVYAGLSLFIIVGPYLYLVVCVIYAYNLAGGGVQAGNEREGAAVREVGASVRVSILTTAILSCLSQF